MEHKTEIEIELYETVAYSHRSESFEKFCPACNSMAEMAMPQVAAILTHTTEREIYRLVETSRVHFIETDKVLICLKSLTEMLSQPPRDLPFNGEVVESRGPLTRSSAKTRDGAV